MSVAQVLTISGLTITGEGPTQNEGVAATKALDGLEHIFSLGNPGDHEGMTIVVWRDKAAMEAGHAAQQANRSKVQQDLGVTITTSKVYEVFNEL
jgi:hypothetical protein